MTEGVIFVVGFVGLLVLRFIVTTIFFLAMLSAGDRCPVCDAATVRVESRIHGRLLPWLRKSWCLSCGWSGLLRRGPLTPTDTPAKEAAGR